MTVAALRHLLNEIDTQGGPEAARHNRLHLPDERNTPMATAPEHTPAPAPLVALRQPATNDTPEQLPVGKLLAWGAQHTDPDVQDQAARAHAALTGLRQRYTTDRELSAITSEREQLEQRLAELQAREVELVPAKSKKQRKPVDYPAAEVRAWAKANGVDCPAMGRVPRAVVEAWRASLPQA